MALIPCGCNFVNKKGTVQTVPIFYYGDLKYDRGKHCKD